MTRASVGRGVLLGLCVMGLRPLTAEEPALGPLPPARTSYVCEEVRRFPAIEAVQGVAVDDDYFYAIANTVIGKYEKETGTFVGRWVTGPKPSFWDGPWEPQGDFRLKHMNSGVVHDGKLYAAHSNFPVQPPTSSIEIFRVPDLKHVDNVSLGLLDGSLTCAEWKDGSWWLVLAHYSEADVAFGTTSARTQLVRCDEEFRRERGWVFPPAVVDRFEPHSCSGATWGPGGYFYCTGHDRKELYVLDLPQAGSTLELLQVVPTPLPGQAIAFDPTEPDLLYGIDRPKREVVVSRLTVSAHGEVP